MQRQSPTDLRPYFMTITDAQQQLRLPLVWDDFFEADQPVELDIGCGRGLFLVNAAIENPDRNYLGIEIDYREGRRAARRLQKRSLGNARILGGDANVAFRELISDASVAAAHVYFPDPWWKKKHQRRRLFTDKFLDTLSQKIHPGGELHSWTDVADYWDVISALVDHHEEFERLPTPEEKPPEHDLDYRTSFERKKRKSGESIYRGRWRRR